MHFRPPLDRPFVTWLAKAALPLVRSVYCGGLDLELTPRAREILEGLDGPAILAPNHPTHDDPLVMFDISRRLGKKYNFVAAYEVFEDASPLLAWTMESVGVYSIIRGTIDRESFRTTRSLLAEKRRTLVMFMEGTAPYQMDSLLPYQAGVVQLGFWSLDDIHKAEGGEQGMPERFPIVPLVMKYVFPDDPLPRLRQILSLLERDVLGAEGVQDDNPDLLDRMATLGAGILSTLEETLELRPPRDATLGMRVEHTKSELLSRLETFLGIQPRANASYTDRLFAARREADTALIGAAKGTARYQQNLFDELRQRLAFLHRDINRLTIFASFYDEYLTEYPSPERIADVLDRLHKEVRGKAARLPRRVAVVDAGEPVDLVQHYDDYKARKKKAVAELTSQVEQQAREILERLYRERTSPTLRSAPAS